MRKETKEVVKTMSDFVNSFSSSNKKFTELMGREHRTLQQNFTKLCVAWFVHLSEVGEVHDLRNEASVKLGELFVEKLGDSIHLPLI